MLQINRKLNTKGRNVTLRTEANYSDGDSKNLATNNVHLYQILDRFGNDSTYQTNRYNVTPTKSWNYSVQATYTEPLAKKLFLQLSYKYTYKYNKSDRTTYAFNDLGEHFFDGIPMDYRNWDAYLSRLANPLPTYEDTKLSRFSEYKNTAMGTPEIPAQRRCAATAPEDSLPTALHGNECGDRPHRHKLHADAGLPIHLLESQ